MSELDKWQCNRCGEGLECEKGKRPLICDNPNCKGKRFTALTGPYTFFDGEKFVPGRLAEVIKQRHAFRTHIKSHVIYAYGNGSYAPDGEELIRREARDALGPELCKESCVYEVVKHIEETTYTRPEEFEAPVNLVNLKNGVLDIKTGEFRDHSSDIVFTNELPVAYDPGADCPAVKKFLSEILDPGDIPIVQEVAGYCLLRDYRFAKAVMLLGEGSNGKSTLLNLIAALLGRENVATPALQDLIENPFAKAELFGKLANIHADLPGVKLKHTGVFKMLTGQDLIWGNVKHKNPFTFRNYAKLLYSANELPRTSDTSEAFWRRWILLNFTKFFPDGNPRTDPQILEKLTTPKELSGFLNFALEGLKRLLAQGRFSQSKSSKDIEEEWIARTDSLRAFVNQHVTYDLSCFATKEDLFTAYLEFCDEHEATPIEKAAVGRRLPVIFSKTSEFLPYLDGKRARAWRGVRFTPPYEKYHRTEVTDISTYLGKIDNHHTNRKNSENSVTSVPSTRGGGKVGNSGSDCIEKKPRGAGGG